MEYGTGNSGLLRKLNEEYYNTQSAENTDKILSIVEGSMKEEATDKMALHARITNNRAVGIQVLVFLCIALAINLCGIIVYQALCVSLVISYFIRKRIAYFTALHYYRKNIINDLFSAYWEIKAIQAGSVNSSKFYQKDKGTE